MIQGKNPEGREPPPCLKCKCPIRKKFRWGVSHLEYIWRKQRHKIKNNMNRKFFKTHLTRFKSLFYKTVTMFWVNLYDKTQSRNIPLLTRTINKIYRSLLLVYNLHDLYRYSLQNCQIIPWEISQINSFFFYFRGCEFEFYIFLERHKLQCPEVSLIYGQSIFNFDNILCSYLLKFYFCNITTETYQFESEFKSFREDLWTRRCTKSKF